VYALLALVLVLFAGCSRSDPGHAISELRSWTATARAVAHAWLDGAIPGHYARRTLALAARRIEATGSRAGAPGDRARNAAAEARRMADAVARGEAGAVRRPLATSDALEGELSSAGRS
jgi:hypothetical protein